MPTLCAFWRETMKKRKVFWAPERNQWAMQRKRKRKEGKEKKKECVIWGGIDGVGKRKVFWAPESK